MLNQRFSRPADTLAKRSVRHFNAGYPSTGPCDSCGHKEGHRVPGGEMVCEACFYAFDPEADYIHGG